MIIIVLMIIVALLSGTILEMGGYYCFKGITLHKNPVFSGLMYVIMGIICYVGSIVMMFIVMCK